MYKSGMNALQVNPATGFTESRSPNAKSFDSEKKLLFLDLAKQSAELGNLPDLPNLCKSVGIHLHTFWNHHNADLEFQQQWSDVMRYCEHTLAQVMFERGKKPGGFMDRIVWLKRHFSEWRDDRQPQILLDIGQLKKVIGEPQGFIDADIVDNKAISTDGR